MMVPIPTVNRLFTLRFSEIEVSRNPTTHWALRFGIISCTSSVPDTDALTRRVVKAPLVGSIRFSRIIVNVFEKPLTVSLQSYFY